MLMVFAFNGNIYNGEISRGISTALHLILSGDPVILKTTGNTLRLGVNSTVFASVIGVPAGCVLGLGRFRGRRVLLAIVNAMTRVPPVVIGVMLLVLFWPSSVWGGGPLSDNMPVVSPVLGFVSPFLGQGLLALPIMTALTAAAVQRVPTVLLEQASVYGASMRQRAWLALREARTGVLAAMVVSLGVTMTAIGVLLTYGGGYTGSARSAGYTVDGGSPATTLALGALGTYKVSAQPPYGDDLLPLSIAFVIIMLGLFLLTAGALTYLQQSRTSWIAGGQS